MDVGSRIRAIRIEKKLTTEELARLIGTTKTTVSKYERGKLHLNSGKIEQIAAALDVSPSVLTGWDVPPTSDEQMEAIIGIIESFREMVVDYLNAVKIVTDYLKADQKLSSSMEQPTILATIEGSSKEMKAALKKIDDFLENVPPLDEAERSVDKIADSIKPLWYIPKDK